MRVRRGVEGFLHSDPDAGGAFGLIIGIIMGSLLLNIAGGW
jgi:hypothetical protein